MPESTMLIFLIHGGKYSHKVKISFYFKFGDNNCTLKIKIKIKIFTGSFVKSHYYFSLVVAKHLFTKIPLIAGEVNCELTPNSLIILAVIQNSFATEFLEQVLREYLYKNVK